MALSKMEIPPESPLPARLAAKPMTNQLHRQTRRWVGTAPRTRGEAVTATGTRTAVGTVVEPGMGTGT
ncbi:MAG TPA: hypothetical protein PKD27_12705, partial [Tepidiformaceae bacterium]|nr:hypothetical protein [Tepidiformaceae bacterium]